MASKDKTLIEVLTQHQAYLYRASSHTVNELLKIFNDESALMLAKLRDLLDELNDSEKVALAGGQYTTTNLKRDSGFNLSVVYGNKYFIARSLRRICYSIGCI